MNPIPLELDVDAVRQAYWRLGLYVGFLAGVFISSVAIVAGANIWRVSEPDILDCMADEKECPWPAELDRSIPSPLIPPLVRT